MLGQLVHYRIPKIGCRPALIVRLWSKETGCANLQVITDTDPEAKSNDARGPILWQTSRLHGGPSDEDCWHLLEECIEP